MLISAVLSTVFFFPPTETRREVPSEPQGADSLRVPCPSGARVQPAPARTRDHAALQTPAADLLALVTHQEDDRQVLLLILHFTQCPSSQLSKRLSLSCSRSSPRSHTLLFLKSAKGTGIFRNFSASFDLPVCLFSLHRFLMERVNRLQTSYCLTRLHHFVCFRPLLLIKRALKVSDDCNIFIISSINLHSCKLWYDWLPPDLHKNVNKSLFKWLVLAGLLSLRVTHFLESHYL